MRVARSWTAACFLAMPWPAAASGLPPLQQPPSAEHHPGKVVFAELITPDLAGAEHFYSALFGWTFTDIPTQGTHYAAVMTNGAQIAGLVEKPLPPGGNRRPFWLTFLGTRDIQASATLAQQYGARLLFAPRTVDDLGQEAVLADPEGGVFGLLASSSGDPPDLMVDDGTWIWSALFTADPRQDAGFYHALFGYQVFSGPGDKPATPHLVVASDGYARASINPYPVSRPGYRPHWINFVRVEDVATAVSKAVSLGAHVLVPPHNDREGDPVAILADPQGAFFGMLEWSNEKPAENAK